jgi:hypothetical protein
MTISELVALTENKLATLARQRDAAWQAGDTAALAACDAQIAETEHTLAKLRSL